MSETSGKPERVWCDVSLDRLRADGTWERLDFGYWKPKSEAGNWSWSSQYQGPLPGASR